MTPLAPMVAPPLHGKSIYFDTSLNSICETRRVTHSQTLVTMLYLIISWLWWINTHHNVPRLHLSLSNQKISNNLTNLGQTNQGLLPCRHSPLIGLLNQERHHEFEGGGSMHWKVGGRFNTVKNTRIWWMWGCMTHPPPHSSYGGTVRKPI